MNLQRVIPTFAVLLLISSLDAQESLTAPYTGPGIEALYFLKESDYIEPGSTVMLGLLITPEKGHHTYWRGPGIVGVPTLIDWDLPKGFEAGPILWPAPEKVNMVGITANGYLGETMLITEIKIPETLTKGTFHLHAKVAWMSCATSCNPGVTERTIRLHYDPEKKFRPDPSIQHRFASVRNEIPPPAPSDWICSIHIPDQDTITLTVSVPGIDQRWQEGLEFFCHDMQVDSNQAMRIHWSDENPNIFTLEFSRPDVAPKSPSFFSGVLRSSKPWPGTNSHFVEIAIPWPEGIFHHE